MAQQPKFDLKMLVMPAILLLGKKIDFKDPEIAQNVTYAFYGVAAFVLTLYAFIYSRIHAQKDKEKRIWVPPKPKPSLPFGLGPKPEPITANDFTQTNYGAHEDGMIREAVQSLLVGGTISYFMSQKFGPMSLLIQAIMIPMNLSDSPLFKKYITGVSTRADGGRIYGELYDPPTTAQVAAVNRESGAIEDDTSSGPVGPDEPRVVELPDEPTDKDKVKKEESNDTKKDK